MFNIWARVRGYILCAGMMLGCLAGTGAAQATDFEVALPDNHAPVTGRLLLAVSKNAEEPREAISFNGAPAFGRDVDQLAPGETALIDAGTLGFPMDNLGALPAGEYYVQALLVTYDRLERSDGHTIWAPFADRRVFITFKPGNLYSVSRKVTIDPAADERVRLDLTETIPAVEEIKDTPWIKRVKMRSEILSDFWGRDVYLRAHVLLPKGYDDHPDARYPVMFPFGHGDTPFSFNTDPETDTESARAAATISHVKTGYQFYQEWNSDDFPRIVAVTFEHPSPYFVESYAVNSANNGPFGDAITKEFIPFLEKEFRLIGQPYSRIVEGASTGGWEAFALQLHYPDYFGGAWVFNPDPISFRHYQLVNIYEDENMFFTPVTNYLNAERPFRRTLEGQPAWTVRQLARLEAVFGSHGRSGYQLDIWQATHGPVGADGYPVPLFDKLTGVIDHDVAEYYRENGYDLTEYARQNWDVLGPKLAGKINLFSGEMDNFYLNLGVYDFQDMVKETAGEDYPIRFAFGRPKQGHSWHHTDWAGVVREVADQVRGNAPDSADNEQWNY